MKTLRNFFKVYQNKLPYKYDTFFKHYKTDKFMQEMEEKGIVFIGGGKRKTYKVINDEEFIKAIFSLGMGGMK